MLRAAARASRSCTAAGPGVDLLVLNTAPLEPADRVAQHGTVLFDDDAPARIHWVAMTRLGRSRRGVRRERGR